MSLHINLPTIKGLQQPLFGRKNDFQTCEKALATLNKPLCLHGAGGVGKSCLANAIYGSQNKEIDLAVWVSVAGSFAKTLISHLSVWPELNINFTDQDYRRPDFDVFATVQILNGFQKFFKHRRYKTSKSYFYFSLPFISN